MKLSSELLNRSIDLGLKQRDMVFLILMSFFSTFTEVIGIGMFLPVFQFIRLEGDINALVNSSGLWVYIIDTFNFFKINVGLATLLITSFILFMARQILNYIRMLYNARVTQSIIRKIRNKMFKSYLSANTTFHDGFPVGDLINVMTTEVNNAVNGIMAPIGLVVSFVTVIGYFSILMFLSLEMSIATVVILLVAAKIPSSWINKSAVTGRKYVNSNNEMSKFLLGRLRSPRLIRLSRSTSFELDTFKRLTKSQKNRAITISKLRAKVEMVMEPLVIGMSLIFLYVASTYLKLEIEIIGLYLVIALRLMPLTKTIVLQWQALQRHLGSIEAIESRRDKFNSSLEVDNGINILNKFKHSISFKNIFYYYIKDKKPILDDISFEINMNTMVAIVGPSGGGKSTLIDLFPRIRTQSSGVVLFDGVNVDKYTLSSIREIISFVPQFPQIFSGTIRSHILYGKQDASNEEIEKALYLSSFDLFLKDMPDGVDTVLADDGALLSGGQRQLLDITRALLTQSPIIILDEPTSNLDVQYKALFKNSMEKIRKETKVTVILVSHDLNAVIDADNIIVLNNGKIECSGNHAKLMESDNWYSRSFFS
jgi:ABC-type multidrug transport system fused ATPase/permease subunit